MFRRQLSGSLVALILIASSLAACAQPDTAPAQPETVPETQPVEVTPTESGVVEPDGSVQSGGGVSVTTGTGVAYPAQVGPGRVQKPKRVKVSDMCKPGTPEYSVREYEQKIQKEMFQNRQGIFSELKDKELIPTFGPKFNWALLRYPVWPIAMPINPPLSTNNIFVLDEANKIVALITDSDQLQKFFTQHLNPVRNEHDARTALIVWLRMQQELAQDGMFQFSIPETSIRITKGAAGSITAAGQSVVAPTGGNQGTLDSKIVFGADGKLASTTNERNIQEGMRPICQSTKLLDKDPIVRRMAEQDILLMGRSCKFYLDEQRAKATPELQAAIDAIWKRIEAGKR
jgi:hypothetical protein